MWKLDYNLHNYYTVWKGDVDYICSPCPDDNNNKWDSIFVFVVLEIYL